MNTLAQAEVRRNRLKNNTTRLSPAPDQAICNCRHKRKLAGYLTECISNSSSSSRGRVLLISVPLCTLIIYSVPVMEDIKIGAHCSRLDSFVEATAMERSISLLFKDCAVVPLDVHREVAAHDLIRTVRE
jgi:hypothetical protein